MKTNMEQFPANNLNPILNVAKDGIILYSNKAGEPLMDEWGVEVGGKLPLSIGDLVQRVISRNNPEKIEVKVGKRTYLVVFHPLPEQECVNISGFDISDQKKLEGKLPESETREMANVKLAEIIDTQSIMANVKLAEIIDTQSIQSLMDEFYKLAHIPIGIIDLKGNVLVSAGWQDVCTKFHRIHPEACKHCIESDIKLTAGILPGEYKLDRCKNNLWHIATPIAVDSQHIGNILAGQFFFDDEPLDYELFQSQARKYGFNEEEYITALDKVPRLSRKTVDTAMSLLIKLANLLSQLSCSNIKLAKSLSEHDTLMKALRKSEKREKARSDELTAVLDAVPVAVYIAHDPQVLQITGNWLAYEWLKIPVGTNLSMSAPEEERPKMFKLFKDGVEIPPANMPSQVSATGIEINDFELDIISVDGEMQHVLGNARPLHDEQGNPRGSISAFIDITERKKAEEKLRESEEKYRNIVETANEGIGIIDDEAIITYANRKLAEMLGYTVEEGIGLPIWGFISEEYKDIVKLNMEKRLQGINESYELKLIHKDGSPKWVFMSAKPIFDNAGKFMGSMNMFTDITKRKEAEESLANIEIARKKEIHHRIKNNLQVLSSLLDLQAEQFKNRKCIKDSEVLEAFRESQDRVISMALIHEELHKGGRLDTLDFSSYIKELVDNLFLTYRLGNSDTSLSVDLEENVYFDMDTAVPLGIIINELVSNSFKHAFSGRNKGEIRIKLHREGNDECKIEDCKSAAYVLSVSDDGVGIPEDLEIEDLDSLGIQLVITLIDQLDGELELRRNNGTEFIIRFTITEESNQVLAPQLVE